jgi:DNA-nicking Smr family endonuclease
VKRPAKHRSVSEDEKILFRKSVAAANPRAVIKAKSRKAEPKSKLSALDGHTKERLKRGEGAPEAKLDLHGMTQAAAHKALLSFLQKSHKKGLRLTLVVTGRGNPEKESAPWTATPHGVLKQMVPRWLNEGDFAAFISGTAPAHIRHGGEGALYVYLRK